MKNSFKKIICFVLALSVVLTGCKKGDDGQSKEIKENVAMGRFIEKEIDFPKASGSIFMGMILNKEDKIEIYMFDKAQKTNFSYILESDNTWTEKEAQWMNDAKVEGMGFSEKVLIGHDGNLYCLYAEKVGEGDIKPHLIKSSDGKAFEEIKIENWDKKESKTNMFPYVQNLVVSENGDIAAGFYDNAKTYRPDGSSYKYEFPLGMQATALEFLQNKIITSNEQNTSILTYDIESGSLVNEIPIDNTSSFPILHVDKENMLYVLNSKGISRLVPGGATWEMIVDGELTSISMPTIYSRAFTKGTDNEFYALFNSDTEEIKLMHYTFDETISSVPSTEISVYSLENNETIRQAAVEFQRNNPDVKINFRVAMTKDSGTTMSDNIKALNTELLGNKGADILILDNMPIDSYIEKGVLADISDIIKPMKDSGEILNGVVEAYENNGKIYAVPARIIIPMFSGKEEVLANTGDLSKLAAYAESSPIPIFSKMYRNSFLKSLFQLESNKLIDEKGELNEKEFVSFLNNMKSISSKMEFETDQRYAQSDIFSIIENKSALDLHESMGISDCMWQISIAKQMGGKNQAAGDIFIPRVLFGINSASKNMDITKEFAKTLLSDSVQTADLYEGFPINTNALDNWDKIEKSMSSAASFGDDSYYESQWPLPEERKMLTDMCRSAKTVVKSDNVLLEMIQSETDAFFKGERTAEETTKAVADRTKAYLSE